MGTGVIGGGGGPFSLCSRPHSACFRGLHVHSPRPRLCLWVQHRLGAPMRFLNILSCLLSYPTVDPAGTFQQAPIPVFPSLGVACTCVGLMRWNRTSARTPGLLPSSHIRGFQGAAGAGWTVLHLRVDRTGWGSRAGSLCATFPPEALGPFCFCVLSTEPGRAGNACVYFVWFRGGPAPA